MAAEINIKEIANRTGHEWESNSAQEISMTMRYRSWLRASWASNTIGWRVTGSSGRAPTSKHPGTCYLHQGGEFTCGLGWFSAVGWTPPAEVPDKEYPFVLGAGRRLYHYHTRTQTGRSVGLNELLGEETADLSSADAEARGIRDGEIIRVRSRRGEVKVKARLTNEVYPGNVWMAFHFRETCANWFTNPAFDPVSQTAEYKACAVQIEKL